MRALKPHTNGHYTAIQWLVHWPYR